MRLIGNILWLLFGGFIVTILYFIVGLVMCVTIIGIPFGLQLFKLGAFAFWPFGHKMVFGPGQPGCLSTVMNLLWILLGWWEIALIHGVFGLLLCLSIVGIPWGVQHFKMAVNSIFPFGLRIE